MSTASKYRNLPDIDLESPDVFESEGSSAPLLELAGDLSLNNQDHDQTIDDNIIKQRLSLPSALNRFQDALLDTVGADFSAELSARKKKMYRSYTTSARVSDLPADNSDNSELSTWNHRPTELKETPLQKLRRLVFETNELQMALEEEQKKKAATGDQADKGVVSPNQLLEHVGSLRRQLEHMTELAGPNDPSENGSVKPHQPAQQLLEQLSAFRKSALSADTSVPQQPAQQQQGTASTGVTYELYYGKDTAAQMSNAALSELEHRLSQLERVVGLDELPDPQTPPLNIGAQLSALESHLRILADTVSNPGNGGISTGLEALMARCKSFTAQMKELKKELEAVNSGGGGAGGKGVDPALLSKINHLYGVIEKSEGLFELVPLLLDRLQSLKPLHLEAAGFAETLRAAVDEQQRIKEELDVGKNVFNRLEQTFNENQETVTKNLKAVLDR